MSADLSYAQPTRNLRLDQTWDQCNGGTVKVYAGAIPANADAALGGATLLATMGFGAPAFGAAAAGVKTANAIASEPDAPATGNATFWRAFTAGAVVVGQGTCGAPGSGEAMILATVTINQHNVVPCVSFVVSEAP